MCGIKVMERGKDMENREKAERKSTEACGILMEGGKDMQYEEKV